MEGQQNSNSQPSSAAGLISLSAIFVRLWQKKWRLLIVALAAFALACLIIIPVPRYYQCSVELAPELGIPNTGGGNIADIASQFGINMGDGVISDAISPELYPELMKSNNFVVQLVDCRVVSRDGTIDTTYFDYLRHHLKPNPWLVPLGKLSDLFSPRQPAHPAGPYKLNPFRLSRQESALFDLIKANIRGSVDRRTNVITISVTDQDPLIAATMADSACHQLQHFITAYRTSKARTDVAYYRKLTRQARAAYEQARQTYGNYADANTDVVLETYKSKQEDLENDMQLKFNTYSAMSSQLQAAEAKVQERTPAFTVLKSAAVPVKPAGPKRMMFILGFTLIALFVGSVYYSRDLIF